MRDNKGLVEFAEKALAEKWGYCLGTFGNILTPALLDQKMKQGYGVGVYNTRHVAYLRTFLGKRVSDCYGLVKAYIWWSGSNPKYNTIEDRNQEMAYRAAKEKGPLNTIPEIPGLILWMPGHAGIYIGNGEFIECVGAPTGMRKGIIKDGRVVAGSKFTHWFKDTYIEYKEEIGKLDLIINGKPRKINGVNKGGITYIRVDGEEIPTRLLGEALGFKVGWDQTRKAVIWND